VKAARQADTEVRRAKRRFEKKLATNIDKDRKSFFAYARSRSKAKPSIGSDTTVLQPQEQAERLNQYFGSVFTEEDKTNMPNAKPLFHGNESINY